jgi:hypothetical protein
MGSMHAPLVLLRKRVYRYAYACMNVYVCIYDRQNILVLCDALVDGVNACTVGAAAQEDVPVCMYVCMNVHVCIYEYFGLV